MLEPERPFRPDLVWLAVITVFNTVWCFVVMYRISQSIAGALHQRKEQRGNCGGDLVLIGGEEDEVSPVVGGSIEASGRSYCSPASRSW